MTPKRHIGPTRRSVSGRYVLRNGKTVEYESTLERDFIIRTAFRLDVREIVAQPVQILFTGKDGRPYRYTPDFLVVFERNASAPDTTAKDQLVEVKPADQWREHWRKWSTKWKAARRYAKERGWTFRVHDETRIRDVALENIQYLQRFRHPRERTPVDARRIAAQLARCGPMPLRRVLDEHASASERREATASLWHLVATRQLDCDVTRTLNEDTVIWMPR